MAKSPTLLEKIANRNGFGDSVDHPILNHSFLFFDLSGNGNGKPKNLDVRGSDADEWVVLGDGDDFVIMGGGDDVVESSAGADILDGGPNGVLGDTITYAGSDAGVIVDLNGVDFLNDRDAQGDLIFGFENVIGSVFADTIFGNFGSNSLYGGDGTDFIRGEHIIIKQFGDLLPPTIFTSGDDSIYGGSGTDTLFGDDDAGGVISIPSNTSVTTFFGGDDTIHGGADDDTIVGDGDAWAKFTNKTSTVNGGNDELFGDGGSDTLFGDGRVQQWAQGGSATINGGEDILTGGAGNDVLWGDAQIVRLVSIPGYDVLTVNGGADIFVFGPESGADQIMDFRQSDLDRIDVRLFGFDELSDMLISSNAVATTIDFGSGNMVTLEGFGSSSVLTEADFIFA